MAGSASSDHEWDNDGALVLTGSANAYVAATSRKIKGYYEGLRICGRANHTNNGAGTIAVDEAGTVPIRKTGNAALVGGEIVNGAYYDFIYDLANNAMQLAAAGAVGSGSIANAQLASMVQSTIKGRAAGAGTGDPTDLTAAQVLTILGAAAGLNAQSFTASGTYTPTVGMKYCLVISTGAGGGGGGADSDGSSAAGAAGGGAGATCIELFDAATIGASQVVTIGAGGLAGADTGGNGGNGGDTTFGALHTAGGGIGGTGVAATTNETLVGSTAGGTATGGLVNLPGGMGRGGRSNGGGAGITGATSGDGGNSFWGGGPSGSGRTSGAGATVGVTATVPGTGGSGASNVNTIAGAAGGVGAAGICFILELF